MCWGLKGLDKRFSSVQYLMDSFACVVNPFTPKSDQLQFSLSVSHQRHIIQYGEFGSR